jgi:hypothetical protein
MRQIGKSCSTPVRERPEVALNHRAHGYQNPVRPEQWRNEKMIASRLMRRDNSSQWLRY